MENNKKIDMLSGNLLKKIIVFAMPLMLSGVLQLLFNACDLIVVGNFAGDDSLAAVGSTSSLISLIVNFFMGISVGANVLVARAIGKKDKEKSQKAVHTTIFFSIVTGLTLSIFGIFCSRYLLELMDTAKDVIDNATLYLKIYFGGTIFNLVYNYGAAILRAKGETKKPLYYLTIAGIINVLLNLFFVIVLNMDVDGVAIATVASQAISAVLVIRCLIKSDDYVHLNIKDLKIDKQSLKEMILIGLPAGIQSALFNISNVFIQKAINSFNSTAILAGNTASSNIGNFIYTSMNAFYQACLTFTSQNYGAGKIKNTRKVLINCLLCVTVAGLVVGGTAVLLGKQLLGIYITGEEALKYGFIRLKIIGLTYFICGIADVLVGSLRGLGYSIVPMFVSILGICGFRLLWIYTAFAKYNTLEVLYVSYPISWIMTSIVHLICFIIVYKYTRKKISFKEKVLA